MTGPINEYESLIKAGELRGDAGQQQIAGRLQELYETLSGIEASPKKGLLGLFRGNQTPPAGIYIHGGVGRGKSMLMDLFFETATVKKKRRVHFHAFMLESHCAIHEWRQKRAGERSSSNGGAAGDDPIGPLARTIAAGARLLCFDEFQVTDVADALILGRLFEALFDEGVTIVATSNRAPGTLYEGGLNRKLFLPFIDMINARMEVLQLDGSIDYRLERIKGMPVYYVPVNEETTNQLREAFWKMTDRDVGDPSIVPSDEIDVGGRTIFVPKCSKGVAVFSFKRLCANPLGAADYLAIAWRYHTVFVVAIPKMDREQKNEAKRFVTLIDVLYENGVKLICSAAAEPHALYPAVDPDVGFARTASRLAEMQSKAYLARGHAV